MRLAFRVRHLLADHWTRSVILLVASLFAFAPLASAQYEIARWTVDAGGAQAMSSTTYTLSGTTGQHDASRSSVGPYELLGGFWGAQGALVVAVPVPEDPGAEAVTFQLRAFPPVPNPAGGATQIRFELPDTRRVHIRVFNVRGELVRDVTNAPRAVGRHLVVWDSRTNAGRPVSSGVYFVRVELGPVTNTYRLILLR